MMLNRAERTVNASIDRRFRAAMPGQENTIDATRRMEERLVAVRNGGAVTGLLAALGALVEARIERARNVRAGTELPRRRARSEEWPRPMRTVSSASARRCARAAGAPISPRAAPPRRGYEGRIQIAPGGYHMSFSCATLNERERRMVHDRRRGRRRCCCCSPWCCRCTAASIGPTSAWNTNRPILRGCATSLRSSRTPVPVGRPARTQGFAAGRRGSRGARSRPRRGAHQQRAERPGGLARAARQGTFRHAGRLARDGWRTVTGCASSRPTSTAPTSLASSTPHSCCMPADR